jgi:hypothetical protein
MKRALLSFGICFLAACSADVAPEPEPAESLKAPYVAPAPRAPAAAPASANLWISPEDGLTSVPSSALRVGVRGLPVPQALAALRALSGEVRLIRVEDGASVPVTVTVPREEAYGEADEVDVAATVLPSSELGEGWYELQVPSGAVRVGPAAHAWVRAREGVVSTRFRVGSEPSTRQVRWNAAQGTLELIHSEAVTPGPDTLAVEIDGSARSCRRIVAVDAKTDAQAPTHADAYACGEGRSARSLVLVAEDATTVRRLGGARVEVSLDGADRIGAIHTVALPR